MLHGSPWIYVHSPCHQMISQTWPQGSLGSSKVARKLQFFKRRFSEWRWAMTSPKQGYRLQNMSICILA